MLQQTITHGQDNRDRTAHPVHSSPKDLWRGQQKNIPASITWRCTTLPSADRGAIISKLSFLKRCQNSIHSLVLVGSTAYGSQTSKSDIDMVIITTTGGHEKVCEAVIEKEIDEALECGEISKFEYTVLSTRQTEKLFEISSPFAYSIRHGAVIQDDGYFLLLRNKRFPMLPGKKYYTTCLYENIATPYYGMLKKLQNETRKKGCSTLCRRKEGGCEGLQAAHMFAKLIMRMLYVTLPSRGMIPLTKADVIIYAKKAYGSQGENAVKQVVSLMRDKQSSFCFDEFRMLKKFAVQLFKEILNVIGMKSTVRDIIRDAARVARGDYHLVDNKAMRNAVM